jgi:hypothetical protein
MRNMRGTGSRLSRQGMSPPTVAKSLTHLTELGIVRELTGKRRHRLFSYAQYFATLDRGTEPLPP